METLVAMKKRDTKIYILYIILIVLVPILLLLWTPFFIYKRLVIVFVKIFCSGCTVGEPLETLGVSCADDNHTKNSSNFSIVSVLELKGSISVARVSRLLQSNVLSGKSVDSRTSQRLMQYPKTYLGHWFWATDTEFDLKNHVSNQELMFDNPDATQVSAHIHETVLNQTFDANKSPWDIRIFQKPSKTKAKTTFVAIRIHHCLGDGKSILKFIVQGICRMKLRTSAVTKSLTAPKTNSLTLPFRFVYFLTLFLLSVPPSSSRQVDCENVAKSSKLTVKLSKDFPLTSFQTIKARHVNLSTSSIIWTSLLAGLQQFADIYEQHYLLDLPVICTMPKPDHPNYFTNHFKVANFPAPCFQPKDSSRLAYCANLYHNLNSHSFEATGMSILAYLFMTLPNPLRYTKAVSMAALSNIAGQDTLLFLDKLPCVGYTLSVGQPTSSCGNLFLKSKILFVTLHCIVKYKTVITFILLAGIQFLVFSYLRKIRFALITRSSNTSRTESEHLLSMVEQNLEQLLTK